jgi:hypothetical protein
MIFSAILGLFAATSLVSSNPTRAPAKIQELANGNVGVVEEDCDVITPKVFIISMVYPIPHSKVFANKLSSTRRRRYGIPMLIHQDQLVTSLPRTSQFQASHLAFRMHIAWQMAQYVNSQPENQK